MAKKICSSCGYQNDSNKKFCVSCGKKLEDIEVETIFCPECGEKLDADSLFCAGCGKKVSELLENDAIVQEEETDSLNQEESMDNEESEVTVGTSFCPECGEPLEDGALFCAGCGTKIALSEDETVSEDNFSDEEEPEDIDLENEIDSVEEPGVEEKSEDSDISDEEEEIEEDLDEEVEYLFFCPECGEEVDSDSTVCPKCGAIFDLDEEDVELEETSETTEENSIDIDDSTEDVDVDFDNEGDFLEESEFDEEELLKKEEEEFDYCPACGEKLEPDSLFCVGCGARLGIPEELVIDIDLADENLDVEDDLKSETMEDGSTEENEIEEAIDESIDETEVEKIKEDIDECDTIEEEKQFDFCPKCGEKLEKGTLFCASCGTKIDTIDEVDDKEELVETDTIPKKEKDSSSKRQKVVASKSENNKRKKCILIIILVLLLTSVLALGYYFFFYQPSHNSKKSELEKEEKLVSVPNVVDKKAQEAINTLQDLSFDIRIIEEETDNLEKVGIVFEQDPSKGKFKKNSEINIKVYVSKEKVEMVSVTFNTLEEAQEKLNDLGINTIVTKKSSDTVEKGKIISQSIQEGEEVSKGGTITIVVSTGKREDNKKPTPTPEETSKPEEKPNDNSWSDWSTSLGKNINENDYEIETKTQYRSRNKETKTSTSSSLSGWTKYDEKVEESSSESKTTTISSSEYETFKKNKNYQITSEEVAEMDIMYAYCTSNNSYHSAPQASGTCPAGTQYVTFKQMSNRLLDTSALLNTYISRDLYDGMGNHEVLIAEMTPSKYKISYTEQKEGTTTYYFYRWSSWSAWQDSEIASNDSLEVATRTMYRYKKK